MNLFTRHNIYTNTFFTNIFIQACTILQAILLARILGPIARGELATIMLWPIFFAGVGLLGINTSISRYAGKTQLSETLANTALLASLITGSLSTLFCWLMMPTLIPEDKHYLLQIANIFLLFIPLNHIGLSLMAIDIGEGNLRQYNFSRALLYPIYFFGLLLCWNFADDKIFWVTLSLIAANASIVLFCLVVRRKSINLKKFNLKELFKSSQPYVVANFLNTFYSQIDKTVIVWFLSAKEIGLYLVAFSAASTINILSNALGIIQFSFSARSDYCYGFDQLATAIRRCFIFSIFAVLGFCLLVPWVLPIIYGNSYSDSSLIALILLPGLIFLGLNSILNEAMRAQGKPLAGYKAKLIAVLIYFLVVMFFSNSMGVKSVAIGLILSESFIFISMLIVVKIHYQDFSWGFLKPTMDDLIFIYKHLRFKG